MAMDEDADAGDRLLDYIDSEVRSPFTYDDLKHRYDPPVNDLPQTFAGLVGDGYDRVEITDHAVEDAFSDDPELLDALTGLWSYLNQEDAWYLSRSFRTGSGNGDYEPEDANLAAYEAAVSAWDNGDRAIGSDTLDALADTGAVSKHGGIAIITGFGWRAIHNAASRDEELPSVYQRLRDKDRDPSRFQHFHGLMDR